jgi:CCR4-NOT transcription complex subunit 4
VTYTKTDDALRAIQAVNNLVVDGRLIKASLGTTKYCSNFLKGQSCHKNECMYLHEVADDELSFTKEDMQQGKHTECERKLHDQMLSQTKSDQPNSHQHQQTQVFHNSQQPHVNGYSNGSKASRNRNDSQNELDKPPPGFSSKAGTAGITDRMSFDAHEVNKKDTAWNDRTSKNSSSVPTTQSFDQSYANAQVGSGSFESSSSRYVNHVPVAESSSCNGVGFARSYSEANSTVVNNDVYHMTSEASNSDFPSDSKLMMTCDELERILLSSHSVPPGFQRQNSIQNSSTTQNTMHSTREAPVPGTGSFNFFLDLYDDLGFDPFSESSKALADMLLEEEEKTNSTN